MRLKKLSVVIAFAGEYEFITETLNNLRFASGVSEIIISVDSTQVAFSEAKLFLEKQVSLFEFLVTIVECSKPGPGAVRNLAITHATNEIILPIDSDDLVNPIYPKLICDVYNTNKNNVGIVYGQAELFGNTKGVWNLPPFSIKTILLENCIYASSGFLKSDWQTVGGYDETLIFGQEDWDLWLKILSLGREVHYLSAETYFYYRIRSGSRSEKFTKMTEQVIWTYDKVYENSIELASKNVEVFTHRRVVLELENATFRKAAETLGKATFKKFRFLRMLWVSRRKIPKKELKSNA